MNRKAGSVLTTEARTPNELGGQVFVILPLTMKTTYIRVRVRVRVRGRVRVWFKVKAEIRVRVRVRVRVGVR